MKTSENLKRILAKSIKPIRKLSVSQWADTYRQLPADSPEPGRWRTSRVPYMREVMDAFTDDRISRIVVKASAQISKTETILNVIGRFVFLDPCTMMIIQPTLDMAMDFSKARLQKMIADTKVLTPLFYEKVKTRDANQTILSKFFTGGRIVLGGANSPAGLASRPIRILLCDEVDRFPADCGEGDPVDLAAKRTSNYWNSKIALFSTPTVEDASRIDVEYLLGTQEEWRYQCPNCGEYHALDYRQMQTDYKISRSGANKIVVVNSVKWRCPDCGFEFGELEMKNAPQRYEAQNPDAIKNGIRSFWLNGFSSPWLTWNEIMREWLEAQGNPAREAVVHNTRFGLSYKFGIEHDEENIFLERREDYDGELPHGVLLLTAAVDVQANRLEYEIVGWGIDEHRFGILRGIIRGQPTQNQTWQELDNVLDRVFKFANGTGMKVARTFIDSGYSTAAVYAYCRANVSKGRFAIKGKAGLGIPLIYRYSNPQNAGVLLTILGVDDGKQEIMSRLSITDGQGKMHFPKDDKFLGVRGYDETYFKQLTAERRTIRRVGGGFKTEWKTKTSHARNESLDVAVYNLAAMKSCVGQDAEKFWQSRIELLSENKPKTQPVKNQKPRITFKEADIW